LLCREYKSIFKDSSGAMVVRQGYMHRYLGMTIDYSTKGVTRILMVDYVKDIVMAWDKVSDGIEMDGFKVKYRK
jgi:hypothetical protein